MDGYKKQWIPFINTFYEGIKINVYVTSEVRGVCRVSTARALSILHRVSEQSTQRSIFHSY